MAETVTSAGETRAVSLKWSNLPGQIGASVAESDFGTSPAVKDALHRAIDADLLTYLPPQTARAAEAACAGYLRRSTGWDVGPGHVRTVADVLAGFRLTMMHLVTDGRIIVPTPGFTPFLREPAIAGREIITVPSRREGGRWRLDLEGIDAAFRDGGKMLMLCNPHNPLGQVMSLNELAEVTAIVEKHGGLVFSDEIHAPLIYPGVPFLPYASTSDVAAEHTITAISASKGWNIQGLKAAQLIFTGESQRKVWDERSELMPDSASVLGAVASAAAYSDESSWLPDLRQRLQGSRDLLASLLQEKLPAVRWTPPEATYLAWLDMSAAFPDGDVARQLAERAGVVVNAGGDYGAGNENWIRFNFAMSDDALCEAVERMAQASTTA